MSTKALLDDFHQFAMDQLDRTEKKLSIDDLYAMWRASNPPTDELLKSVAAVKAALDDMEAGDTGISVEQHLAKLRQRFHLAGIE